MIEYDSDTGTLTITLSAEQLESANAHLAASQSGRLGTDINLGCKGTLPDASWAALNEATTAIAVIAEDRARHRDNLRH